jgi:hypothetical protein
MPRIMNVFEPMEIIVTPATTYIVAHQDNRRIYTDGRDWPGIVPTFRAIRSANGSTPTATASTIR